MLITEASFPPDTADLTAVIREYVAWLDLDLSYRGFEEEMVRLEELFSRPKGFFLLARSNGVIAGCVGLLRHDDRTAEVKRLYVKPAFRGQGLGHRLLSELIGKARQWGIGRLILDAVPQTTAAQRLYEAMGFQATEPYYDNPVPGTKFYALDLHVPPGRAVQELRQLTNLGPKSADMLAAAGIESADHLRRLGAVNAYALVKGCNAGVSLNLLWALEGALTGQHWQTVARDHRTSLLFALDALERGS